MGLKILVFLWTFQGGDYLLGQQKPILMKVFLGFIVSWCCSFYFPLILFSSQKVLFSFFYPNLWGFLFDQLNLRRPIQHHLKMVQASISFLVLKELPKKQWVYRNSFCNCYSLFTIWCRSLNWVTALIESIYLNRIPTTWFLEQEFRLCVFMAVHGSSKALYIYTPK